MALRVGCLGSLFFSWTVLPCLLASRPDLVLNEIRVSLVSLPCFLWPLHSYLSGLMTGQVFYFSPKVTIPKAFGIQSPNCLGPLSPAHQKAIALAFCWQWFTNRFYELERKTVFTKGLAAQSVPFCICFLIFPATGLKNRASEWLVLNWTDLLSWWLYLLGLLIINLIKH